MRPSLPTNNSSSLTVKLSRRQCQVAVRSAKTSLRNSSEMETVISRVFTKRPRRICNGDTKSSSSLSKLTGTGRTEGHGCPMMVKVASKPEAKLGACKPSPWPKDYCRRRYCAWLVCSGLQSRTHPYAEYMVEHKLLSSCCREDDFASDQQSF